MTKKNQLKVSPILIIMIFLVIVMIIMDIYFYSNPAYRLISKYIPIIFAVLLLYEFIRNIKK